MAGVKLIPAEAVSSKVNTGTVAAARHVPDDGPSHPRQASAAPWCDGLAWTAATKNPPDRGVERVSLGLELRRSAGTPRLGL
jgi:hypothetical protein